MSKRCAICDGKIEEEFEKLKGVLLKIRENDKSRFVYVCSDCQKKEGWIEKAKIRAA